MPGEYAVEDRDAKIGRAGLALPFTNTQDQAKELSDQMLAKGLPRTKMSIYVTNKGASNCAVEFRVMGEFGEIEDRHLTPAMIGR